MKKQCAECKSSLSLNAPYCEACGFQMRRSRTTARPVARWKYRSAAIVTGLVVAVAHFLLMR